MIAHPAGGGCYRRRVLDVMLALLPFGLLEVLLVLLAATLVIGVVVSFGYPVAVACGIEGVTAIDGTAREAARAAGSRRGGSRRCGPAPRA